MITGKSHLHISRNRAYWCEKNPHTRLEKSYCLTLETLCKWIELLIDNIYVFYGGQVFKQIIGIPMGTDCAPVLANLFLLYYERKYIFNLVEIGDTDTLYKLSNTGRFIDDLISINDHCKLLELLTSIYPSCMTVNKTNPSTKHATYLDMDLSISNNNFISKVYDKRRDFSFKVRNLTHFDSNLATSAKVGLFIGQLNRFLAINSNYEFFSVRMPIY